MPRPLECSYVNSRRHSLSRYLDPRANPLADFRITRGKTQPGFADLPCLLARVWPDGRFELINHGWETLGYSEEELLGRRFCDLVAMEETVALALLSGLLTEGRSMQFPLRSKDGSALEFHWNRQFDDFSTSMFVIGILIDSPRTRVAVIRENTAAARSVR